MSEINSINEGHSPPNKKPKFEASQPDVIDLSQSSSEDESSYDIADLSLNNSYVSNVDVAANIYQDGASSADVDFLKNNMNVIEQPFKVVQMRNFVHEQTLLAFKEQISQLEFQHREMDLYSYSQSSSRLNFKNITRFVREKIGPFVAKVCGLKFNENVAVNISQYNRGDYLLCHDDQLKGRKIAFILYLVDPNWNKECGGLLELFDYKKEDQSMDVAVGLTPEWNLFTFFEVTSKSYHQVSEVLTSQYPRLSINGWFFANGVKVEPRKYAFPSISTTIFPSKVEENKIDIATFYEWINPIYVSESQHPSIRNVFLNKSEIQLKDFLNSKKLEELTEALNSLEVSKCWEHYYCPMMCKYDYIPEVVLNGNNDDGPIKIIQSFFKLLTSEQFVLILSQMTGVNMHQGVKKNIPNIDKDVEVVYEAEQNVKIRSEFRRWNKSHYSLLNDFSPERLERKSLDVMLFIDSTPLVTVCPSSPSSSENEQNDPPEESAETLNDNNVICEVSIENFPSQTSSSKSKEDRSDSPKPSTSSDVETAPPKVSSSTDSQPPQEMETETNAYSPKPSTSGVRQQANSLAEKRNSVTSTTSKISSISFDFSQDVITISDSDDSNEGSDHDSRVSGDYASSSGEEVLEPMPKSGGYIAYVCENDRDSAILNIDSIGNTLNMVYRLKGVQRFMKYINIDNDHAPFYQISLVYNP